MIYYFFQYFLKKPYQDAFDMTISNHALDPIDQGASSNNGKLQCAQSNPSAMGIVFERSKVNGSNLSQRCVPVELLGLALQTWQERELQGQACCIVGKAAEVCTWEEA